MDVVVGFAYLLEVLVSNEGVSDICILSQKLTHDFVPKVDVFWTAI